MSDNTDNRRSPRPDEEENSNGYLNWIGTAAGITAAVVAGGLLWATRGSSSTQSNQTASSKNNQASNTSSKQNQAINPSSKQNRASKTSSNNNQSSSSSTSSINNQSSNTNSKNKQSSAPVKKAPAQTKVNQNQCSQSSQTDSSSSTPSQSTSLARGIINILSSVANMSSSYSNISDKVASCPPPVNPCITNLNGLLADIYVRFIQIKNTDFNKHYSVFDNFFQQLQVLMKEVDPYYNKYSSMKQFAGSHYDNLRIKSADEFDMDIIIGLCLNLKENPMNPADSDIVIQHQAPGFVQLKMGTQYLNMPMRDGDEWQINKAAFKWKDEANYLLRSKFLDWFKSVVSRALDKLPTYRNLPVMNINGRNYTIRNSESGPSVTLYIENQEIGFKLDVDLVPALKFPEERWPISKVYRHIPHNCKKGFWMVVGKPNKNGSSYDQNRSWRIALHYQERDLIHNLYNLKPTLRTTKCLRDAQGMNKIASYYIKTLFLWEVVEQNDNHFWRKDPAFLFQHMVKKLYDALVRREIPYFWNKNNNMIKHIDASTLSSYAAILEPLLKILENQGGGNYKNVAKYLLTKTQFVEYNNKYLI